MKRYSIGVLALCLALGAVAFTEIKKSSATNYFWYRRTSANVYVDDLTPNTAQPSPSVTCSGAASICVKGFLASQTASSIKDTTSAQQEQKKTP
ncbi:MAG: hypothetical protein QM802_02475 [Agriterribacter sp.]